MSTQEDTMQPYTDADVLDLQDVIADARIRGIGNGTYSMARAILEAGYRPSRARSADEDCAGCVGMGPCARDLGRTDD